jgi:hypothetical protein
MGFQFKRCRGLLFSSPSFSSEISTKNPNRFPIKEMSPTAFQLSLIFFWDFNKKIQEALHELCHECILILSQRRLNEILISPNLEPFFAKRISANLTFWMRYFEYCSIIPRNFPCPLDTKYSKHITVNNLKKINKTRT